MDRMRILIVDDDRALRDALRRALVLGGYDTVPVEDGESALAEVARSEPDAVVLDIGLPDIDGLEVAARLTAAAGAPAVILTSSRDATDFLSLVAPSGARGFIPKHELSGAAIAALSV